MVDPIEIRLDEIDARLQRIIDTSYERNIGISGVYGKGGTEDYSHYRPKGFTGESPSFLDTAISKLVGGSRFGGILAGGAAAGGVAGAVLILADVMKEAVKQSKIASMLSEKLSGAIGLMMDLILIPFLPALTWALINLYGGITSFGTWWSEVWETIKKEGLVGLLKLGLQWSWDILLGWEKKILEWFFGDKTIGEKTAGLLVAFTPVLKGVFSLLLGDTVVWIMEHLFGEKEMEIAKTISLQVVVDLIDNGIKWISDLLEAIVTGDLSKIAHQLKLDIIPQILGFGGSGGESGGGSSSTTTTTTNNYNAFDALVPFGPVARLVYNESQRILDSRYSAGGG